MRRIYGPRRQEDMGGTFILFIFFVFFYIYTYVVQQCKLCVEYDSHSAYEEAEALGWSICLKS